MFEKGHFNLGLTVSIVVGLLVAYVLISLLHNARNRVAVTAQPAPAHPGSSPAKKPIGFTKPAQSEPDDEKADDEPADD